MPSFGKIEENIQLSYIHLAVPYILPSVHFIVLLLSNLIALKSQPTRNCFAGPELESLYYLKGLLNFRKCHKRERISQFLPKHCRNFKNTRNNSSEIYLFREFFQVDRGISEELRSTGSFEVMSLDTDEAEHSIEMHLPYIAKMMAPKVIISQKRSSEIE